VTAAQAGKTTVENNHLSQQQQQSRSEELIACGSDTSCKANVREKYAKEFDKVQEQINNCSSADQCVALAKEMKQWKSDNTVRLDELSSKARNGGADSLTPAEVQEWANLRGAQSNFDGSINTLIYRAQILGGSEETTTELTNIFGHAAIENAAGIAGGISKAGKGSSLPTPTKTTAENGLDYQSNPKHTPGQQGYSPKAGTEPKDSINLFSNSIEYGKNDMQLMLMAMFINLQIQMMEHGIGLVVQGINCTNPEK
jgi:filamentous hemagglutinin